VTLAVAAAAVVAAAAAAAAAGAEELLGGAAALGSDAAASARGNVFASSNSLGETDVERAVALLGPLVRVSPAKQNDAGSAAR
jgi:hypothetical protein